VDAARQTPKGKTPAEDVESRQHLSFTDAAERVLTREANGEPMHYRDITERALALGLVRTDGKTPEHTLYASILEENKRRVRRGETPRFIQHGRGRLSLAEWQHSGLARQIDEHNLRVRQELLGSLKELDPTSFEGVIGELLVALGFEDVAVMGRSGDGGIDVRGTLVVGDVIRTRMAVQAKRWKHNVQSPIVQQVRGSLGTHEQGLIITTSDFSSGARLEAQRPNAVPVALMNGYQLVALMVEHEIGVQRSEHYLIELGTTEEVGNPQS
jgi:restriction system protein